MQAKSTSSFNGPKKSDIFLVHCSFFFFISNFFFCRHLTLSFLLWSDTFPQVFVLQGFCFDHNQKTRLCQTDTSILDSEICELAWSLYLMTPLQQQTESLQPGFPDYNQLYTESAYLISYFELNDFAFLFHFFYNFQLSVTFHNFYFLVSSRLMNEFFSSYLQQI